MRREAHTRMAQRSEEALLVFIVVVVVVVVVGGLSAPPGPLPLPSEAVVMAGWTALLAVWFGWLEDAMGYV